MERSYSEFTEGSVWAVISSQQRGASQLGLMQVVKREGLAQEVSASKQDTAPYT